MNSGGVAFLVLTDDFFVPVPYGKLVQTGWGGWPKKIQKVMFLFIESAPLHAVILRRVLKVIDIAFLHFELVPRKGFRPR